MTGACHHLSPASVLRDARCQAPKAFPSIAGAKIQRFSATTKFWHVIRVDFQQLPIIDMWQRAISVAYDLKFSLKKQALSGGRISMFYGLENYVLRYKSVFYEVIADYWNVFSIQYSVFFAVVTIRYIDSILYIIIYIIIYNIK